MPTPYSLKPYTSFWRQAVAGLNFQDIDPVLQPAFLINRHDKVATAGSCFAQHISSALREREFTIMITEAAPLSAEAEDENYGVYSARFGNIYTIRQLLQLFNRAYQVFVPSEDAWVTPQGRFVDPFRPQVQRAGFQSADAVRKDRAAHFSAVRTMFETCDVLIFTLGLTEAWVSTNDGSVFPVVPQAVAQDVNADAYGFRNFTVAEMTADFTLFMQRLKSVNPMVRVILTVSPVPLIATYEDRHVLVSNTFSKAALRVVADEVCRSHPGVDYFPSFELITGAHTRGAYFATNLRDVTAQGVEHVMQVFARHYLRGAQTQMTAIERDVAVEGSATNSAALLAQRQEEALMRDGQRVICDEMVIESSL